jgi:glycerophosphoryl diester phosphodiesterase
MHGMEKQVTITSFQDVRLEEMRAYAPELPTGVRTSYQAQSPATNSALRSRWPQL